MYNIYIYYTYIYIYILYIHIYIYTAWKSIQTDSSSQQTTQEASKVTQTFPTNHESGPQEDMQATKTAAVQGEVEVEIVFMCAPNKWM